MFIHTHIYTLDGRITDPRVDSERVRNTAPSWVILPDCRSRKQSIDPEAGGSWVRNVVESTHLGAHQVCHEPSKTSSSTRVILSHPYWWTNTSIHFNIQIQSYVSSALSHNHLHFPSSRQQWSFFFFKWTFHKLIHSALFEKIEKGTRGILYIHKQIKLLLFFKNRCLQTSERKFRNLQKKIVLYFPSLM